MIAAIATASRSPKPVLGSPESGFWTRRWMSTAVVHRAGLAHPARISTLPRMRFDVPRAASDPHGDSHLSGDQGHGRDRDGRRRVVGVGTPSGEWLIGLDPATRLCVAVHRPTEPNRALFDVAAHTVTAASSWELEAALGVPFGEDVHRALRAQTVTMPLGVMVGDVLVAARGADRPSVDESRAPRASDLVRVPGAPPCTYAASLARSDVLLRWEQGGLEDPSDVFRVDVVAAGEVVRDGRRELVYRLSLNGQVLAAGDDIEVPTDLEVRSSNTIRGLIAMLTSPDDDLPPNTGQETVLRRRDELLSLVAENPGPFRPDERVEVLLPDGRLLTGTVAFAVPGSDGTARSYQWIPDAAWPLGGHGGHGGNVRGGFVSPASAVRASLLPAPPVLGAHPDEPAASPSGPLPSGSSLPLVDLGPGVPGVGG